MMHKVWSFVSF